MAKVARHYKLISFLMILVIIGFAVGFYQKQQLTKITQLNDLAKFATVMPQPFALEHFNLTDDHGNVFSEQQLMDHWSFMFFGFTRCQKICPATMSALRQVAAVVDSYKDAPKLNVIMVSVDPEHDGVKEMANYVHSFNSNFIGLTGDKDQIKKLAKQVYISYGQDKASSTLVHSGTVLLVDTKGRVRALFTAPQTVNHLVQGFAIIANEHA